MNPMLGILIGAFFGLMIASPFIHAAWESERDFDAKENSEEQ